MKRRNYWGTSALAARDAWRNWRAITEQKPKAGGALGAFDADVTLSTRE